MSEVAPDLQTMTRAKLASGELPRAKPEKVWAGKGTGQTCSACGRVITTEDIEYEVDLPGAQAAMRLHHACLTSWDQNRNDLPPRIDAA